MKQTRLKDLIIESSPALFKFSYALIPHQKQAEQLVLNAAFFYIKNKKLISTKEFSVIEKSIYKSIFSLANKDNPLEDLSLIPSAFHSLSLPERGCLFLKHKSKFCFNDCAFILNIEKTEFISLLNLGREKLMLSMGQSLDPHQGLHV